MEFNKIASEYLSFVTLKGKPQSIRSIKSRINNYIIPYFKNYNIEEIDKNLYLKWQLDINSKGFKYKYKKTLHYTMVAIYNYAFKFYDINCNIPSKVGNFNNSYEIEDEINIWSFEEFKKFISIINEPIYKELFNFMYFTGCRLGECLALTFNDLNDNVININKTISKEYINGKRQITKPKTKKSIRKIHIDNLLKNELNNLRVYYNNINNYFQEDFYIFGGIKPLAPSTIERKKNNYCKKANVKQIKLHAFRHSHASLLLNNGIPISEISERLGHSNINTTLSVYIHLINNDEKKVLTVINTIRNAN